MANAVAFAEHGSRLAAGLHKIGLFFTCLFL